METIDTVQLRLTALWVALMLIYLLGDVLRIFSGDFKAGEIMGTQVTQTMWLGIAALMVLPIVMIVLTLTLGQPANRWLNIIVAVFFFLLQSGRAADVSVVVRPFSAPCEPRVQRHDGLVRVELAIAIKE